MRQNWSVKFANFEKKNDWKEPTFWRKAKFLKGILRIRTEINLFLKNPAKII